MLAPYKKIFNMVISSQRCLECPCRAEFFQIFTNTTQLLKDLIRFVGFLAVGDYQGCYHHIDKYYYLCHRFIPKLIVMMMKTKIILACLLFSLCMASHAQSSQLEYRPFAEDGKVWESQVGGIKDNVYGNRIDGDTLIGGKTWKKVYNYVFMSDFGTSYYAAIRDEDKKVYAIARGSNKTRLLYDFGLTEGDIVMCGVEGNAFGCLLDKEEQVDTLLGFPFASFLRVERIDTIVARGLQHRRFTLTLLDTYKEHFLKERGEFIDNVVWVEGIGSGAGPFSPWLPMPPKYSFLQLCEVNRTCIFGYPDFYDAKEVDAISVPCSVIKGRDENYGLQGRRLSGTPRHGVYIYDGRKVVVK